jgi:FkbM family methyltransferase
MRLRRDPARQAVQLAEQLSELPAKDAAIALTQLVEALPDETIMEFASALEISRLMDYEREDVRLLLTSRFIRFRLQAAGKEPATVEWIERRVRPGDVFYDIGANVGPYALIAAAFTQRQAKIYAFEPSAGSYHDLCRNLVLNDCHDAIVPLPVALWSQTTLTVFQQRTLAAGAGRHLLAGVPSERKAVYREPLLAYALDDLVEQFGLPVPNHVKLDVDGPELQVLQGASLTLRRPEWRSLIVEVERDQEGAEAAIADLMVEAGFSLSARHDRGERAPAYLSFDKPSAML